MGPKRKETPTKADETAVKKTRTETALPEDTSQGGNIEIDKTRYHDKTIPCAFTQLERAYGQEVHMFIHTHMRGYDKDGDGKSMDTTYYDKYGAPVDADSSWSEGYHEVEMELRKHFTHCLDPELDFPLVGGMSGGTHLYKNHHNNKPYNWTGWVPLKRRWLSNKKFFHNRDILTLRGNEIQNNLWDYDPYYDEEATNIEGMEGEQMQPTDRYRGGYFFPGESCGRYLHVMALKSHKADTSLRYNFIVHPLAYRRSLNTVPDNSVDHMQWCYLNVEEEEHFTNTKKNWGDKIHGAEVFNDFSYYYSWTCITNDKVHNGEVMNYKVPNKVQYRYWFDTYPLEFAEFLIDTALKMGVYLHILSANDAFYSRGVLPPEHTAEHEGMDSHLLADPKGVLITSVKPVHELQDSTLHCKKMQKLHAKGATSKEFIDSRPYKADTVFGYTTLLDPYKEIRKNIIDKEDLEGSEVLAVKFLREARFYAHTGVYNLFEYDVKKQAIPYVIKGQIDQQKLCYDMTEVKGDGKLVFDILPSIHAAHLIWRYTIESVTGQNSIESVQGYFKLDQSKMTHLDLSNYDPKKVKWLRFTAFRNNNPHRRAWFCAIRGLAFNSHKKGELPEMKYRVATVEEDKAKSQDVARFIKETGTFQQDQIDSNGLDFWINKCTTEEEENIYTYCMQVNALQQDLNKPTTQFSQPPPKRYLESVHGYFKLNEVLPTRLYLNNSWDKSTVKDNKIYFHAIDTKTGAPKSMSPTLIPKPANTIAGVVKQ